jgi:hypothetical protein
VVTVEEAYIHRSWYIPKLEPVRRTRDWGTDDTERAATSSTSPPNAARRRLPTR